MTADRTAAAIAEIRSHLAGYVFRVRTESELQEWVTNILRAAGITVAREVRVATDRGDGAAGRLDILAKFTDPDDHVTSIVLELKLGASAAAVERQAQRYAMMPDVDAVVVVTTSKRLVSELANNGGPTLGGKPFHAIAVRTT